MVNQDHGWLWGLLSLAGGAAGVAVAWILRGFAGGRELGKIEGKTEARLDQHDERHDRTDDRLVRLEDRMAQQYGEINTKIDGISKMLVDLISKGNV